MIVAAFKAYEEEERKVSAEKFRSVQKPILISSPTLSLKDLEQE